MIRTGVVGLGKMGMSHFALVNPHPKTLAIACDATGFLIDGMSKYIDNPTWRDYDKMIEGEKLDAVVIATPSRAHAPMVRKALERGIHVFCEKPFCLDWEESFALADMAEEKGLVNQVGYHYRFVGAFQEMKRLLEAGAIGTVTHATAEAYGPVVLRPKKGSSWRTTAEEGGGCLYDYAAHPINLLNWFFGEPMDVSGSVLNSIFSAETDDEVYSTFRFDSGISAQLSVNWSDESHRKMSTKITVLGTNGRLYADRQECQLYLREPVEGLTGYDKGWNVRYTTDLTRPSWYYMRGEEYSNQLDDFITAIADGTGKAVENDFRSAAMTDKTISMILADRDRDPMAETAARPVVQKKRGWFSRA